jgi:hypothetical protein
MASGSRAARGRKGAIKEAVATIGMFAMALGGAAGAYTGFRWAGLGAAFFGFMVGAAAGFGLVYLITNVVRRNSRFFTLLLVIAAIGLMTWGLHALGALLGFNPP